MEIEVKSVLMEWGRGGWARRCFSGMPSCKATFGLALCRETSARAEGGGAEEGLPLCSYSWAVEANWIPSAFSYLSSAQEETQQVMVGRAPAPPGPGTRPSQVGLLVGCL